eukprot:TRINITY_DN69194_c0_g1_i1.p1 TRINITY_DN69194_c0_g1~~TRINITY_DN69194_c0_g1_i1.p1  ORF type:complete len:174 (+),score=46.58 TRINITY_DN69194_c0_g1_i1:34-555(+)
MEKCRAVEGMCTSRSGSRSGYKLLALGLLVLKVFRFHDAGIGEPFVAARSGRSTWHALEDRKTTRRVAMGPEHAWKQREQEEKQAAVSSSKWMCSCGSRNFNSVSECFKCGASRPSDDGVIAQQEAGVIAAGEPEMPREEDGASVQEEGAAATGGQDMKTPSEEDLRSLLLNR